MEEKFWIIGARIFTKQALEEKKNSNLENKLKKNIVKSNKRQYENALLNETSIVPNYPTNVLFV